MKKNRFLRGMCWYAIILLGIVAIALIFQYRWLYAYDKARSKNVIDNYMTCVTYEYAKPMIENPFADLDADFTDIDSAMDEYVAPYFETELRYLKDSSKSSSTTESYVIKSEDTDIGRVTLEQNGEDLITLHLFGSTVRTWNVTAESYDFSFLSDISSGSSSSITIPEDYSVSFNGKMLDESYITARENKYEDLDFLKSYGVSLPYMVTYTVSDYIGNPEFQMYDPDGNATDTYISFEDRFLNNCTETEISSLVSFMNKYCEKYVAYMGSHRDLVYTNYSELAPYLLPNGELAERILNSIDGMTWSNNKYNKIEQLNVNFCYKLGDGDYLCDVNYNVRTMGASGAYVTTANYYRICVQWNDSGMYVYDMTSYKNAEVIDG